MPSEVWVGLGSALAAVVGAILTYRKFTKTHSGNIDSTDASTLWEEARKMRDSLSSELEELKENAKKSIQEIIVLKTEQVRLSERLVAVEREAEQCRQREAALTQRVSELEATL